MVWVLMTVIVGVVTARRIGSSAAPGSADRRVATSSLWPIRGVAGIPTLTGVVIRTIRAIWSEPATPDAAGPTRRDLLLVAFVMVIAPLETLLRTDLVWPAPSMAVVIAGACLLPFRRVHPLMTTAAVIGIASAVQLVALVRDVPWEGLGTGIVFLVLPYSLGRWGSGRQALGGATVFAVPVALTALGGGPPSETLGGAAIVLLAAAVGAGVRFRAASRREQLASVRARERAELARDLHDSVAHHVTAIAVQAQAGRALIRAGSPGDASTADPDVLDPAGVGRAVIDPAVIDGVLAVIEEQASRSLDEMRSIVGALRRDDRAELSPHHGLRDIERLSTSEVPRVTVEVTGAVDELRPSVDTAVYRIAAEAITNARRHATGATRVQVRVDVTSDVVRLTVVDDGHAPGHRPRGGYGLVGMAERIELLSGRFSAGPHPGGGWTVTAELPNDGTTRHLPGGSMR